ncbi:hypothetical protein NL676_017179 [Syzygium grande]|nr:hypothetical protein NL676_017179 [Syzygium grande]
MSQLIDQEFVQLDFTGATLPRQIEMLLQALNPSQNIGRDNGKSNYLALTCVLASAPEATIPPSMLTIIKSFNTTRKLIHSLQDPSDVDSDMIPKSLGRFRSPCSSVDEWSPVRNFDQGGLIDDPHDAKEKENSNDGAEQFQGGFESLSSADNVAAGQENLAPSAMTPQDVTRKAGKRMAFKLICSILTVLLAISCSLQYIDDHEYRHLVPT